MLFCCVGRVKAPSIGTGECLDSHAVLLLHCVVLAPSVFYQHGYDYGSANVSIAR